MKFMENLSFLSIIVKMSRVNLSEISSSCLPILSQSEFRYRPLKLHVSHKSSIVALSSLLGFFLSINNSIRYGKVVADKFTPHTFELSSTFVCQSVNDTRPGKNIREFRCNLQQMSPNSSLSVAYLADFCFPSTDDACNGSSNWLEWVIAKRHRR